MPSVAASALRGGERARRGAGDRRGGAGEARAARAVTVISGCSEKASWGASAASVVAAEQWPTSRSGARRRARRRRPRSRRRARTAGRPCGRRTGVAPRRSGPSTSSAGGAQRARPAPCPCGRRRRSRGDRGACPGRQSEAGSAWSSCRSSPPGGTGRGLMCERLAPPCRKCPGRTRPHGWSTARAATIATRRPRLPSRRGHEATSAARSSPRSSARRGAARAARARAHPHAGRLRGRQRRRRPHVRRRGAGRQGGRAGDPVRRRRRQAARPAAGGGRAGARRRVHRQRPASAALPATATRCPVEIENCRTTSCARSSSSSRA